MEGFVFSTLVTCFYALAFSKSRLASDTGVFARPREALGLTRGLVDVEKHD